MSDPQLRHNRNTLQLAKERGTAARDTAEPKNRRQHQQFAANRPPEQERQPSAPSEDNPQQHHHPADPHPAGADTPPIQERQPSAPSEDNPQQHHHPADPYPAGAESPPIQERQHSAPSEKALHHSNPPIRQHSAASEIRRDKKTVRKQPHARSAAADSLQNKAADRPHGQTVATQQPEGRAKTKTALRFTPEEMAAGKPIHTPGKPGQAPAVPSISLNRAGGKTAQKKLRFGESAAALPIQPVTSVAAAASSYGNRQMEQSDNVSVQAAGRANQAAEETVRTALRYRQKSKRSAHQDRVHQSSKTAGKFNHQRTGTASQSSKSRISHRTSSGAGTAKSGSRKLSRAAQKQHRKRQYAKAARNSKKAAESTVKTIGKAIAGVGRLVAAHPYAALIVVVVLAVIFVLIAFFGALANITNTVGTALVYSYTAEDTEIEQVELAYTEWETDLRFEIADIETDYPDYDEYRYNIGIIGHSPFELMSYLTAVYQNFTFSAVSADLQTLFQEQYTLTIVPSVETRYADPDDENEDGDTEPYDWNVLTVTLDSKPLGTVVQNHMTDEQAAHYDVLKEGTGNRQTVANPFPFDWLPLVTSSYGYRVHPVSGEKKLHRGVDISLPLGTDIRSGQDGIVTFAGYDSSYGNLVIVENESGLTTKYAHCNTLNVTSGETVTVGQTIATVGNTGISTGPHLHIEVLQDGVYLNPLFSVSPYQPLQ